jgi:hypothetical protein
MSDPTENKASSASERPERGEVILTLTTSRRMLPLVRRIVADILAARREILRLQPERDRLDRLRQSLDWEGRSRRYQVREDLAEQELKLQDSLAELEVLGVSLLDEEAGRIGFPTLVNGRRAFFSWRPNEDSLRAWHFASDSILRPIPASWVDPIEKPLASKR